MINIIFYSKYVLCVSESRHRMYRKMNNYYTLLLVIITVIVSQCCVDIDRGQGYGLNFHDGDIKSIDQNYYLHPMYLSV